MLQKDFVTTFGTKVKCGTERYVLELHGLTEPVHFINPKDAGTKYGDQNLKGNGQDILLLNGVTPAQVEKLDCYLNAFEQETGKKAEDMNTAQVRALLRFLEENGYNDRYCSDLAYKEKALIPTVGRMCRRSNDECRAVVIPKGTVYEDGEKSQQATVDGALFVVDSKGGARITNVPSDYEPVQAGAKIVTYADVVRHVQNMKVNGR